MRCLLAWPAWPAWAGLACLGWPGLPGLACLGHRARLDRFVRLGLPGSGLAWCAVPAGLGCLACLGWPGLPGLVCLVCLWPGRLWPGPPGLACLVCQFLAQASGSSVCKFLAQASASFWLKRLSAPMTVSGRHVDLQAQSNALDQKISQGALTLGALRRQVRRRPQVSRAVELTTKALFLLTRGDLASARGFLAMCPGVRPPAVAALLSSLPVWSGSLQPEERSHGGLGTDSAEWTRAMKRAGQFMTKQSLHTWVREQNVVKGITPTSSTILAWLDANDTSPELAACCDDPRKRSKHRHQWLRRWRRRWNLRLGTLRAREWLSKSEKQAKAGVVRMGLGGRPDGDGSPVTSESCGRENEKRGCRFPGPETGPFSHLVEDTGPGK